MAKLDSRNILLESGDVIYRFINCKMEPNDGSYYVTLCRSGENSESFTFDSGSRLPIAIQHDTPRKKLVWISYHSSGCVLYRHTQIPARYFEPISRITKPNIFAVFSVPSIERLDKAESVQDEDFIISADDALGRIEFTLMLAPWQHQIKENHFAVRYEGILSLIVIPNVQADELHENLRDHFITLTPKRGPFEKQVLADDQALIEYHQLLQQTKDLILYSPNKAGIYTIITVVPMRAAPDVRISFVDERLKMALVSWKTNVIKFKVKNQHDHVVKEEAPIRSIELSAEL